jgi:molybdenum cofactor cytidylyltransferase
VGEGRRWEGARPVPASRSWVTRAASVAARTTVDDLDLVKGVGSIVLAAGTAERPARAELLRLGGEALARRAARAAVEAGLWPVVVVVGDRADEVRAELAGLPLVTVANPGFAAGQAGSLGLGLRRLIECAPGAAGAMVLACDRPAVRAGHLRALVQAARDQARPLAASACGRTLCLPALVPVTMFEELRALAGDGGLPDLLAYRAAEIAAVAFPEGELDAGTPEGWARARALLEP